MVKQADKMDAIKAKDSASAKAAAVKRPVEHLINMVMAYLLSASCVYAITMAMQLSIGLWQVMLTSAALLVLYFVVFYNRRTFIAAIIVIGMITLFAAVFLFTEDARSLLSGLADDVKGMVIWFIDWMNLDREYIVSYADGFTFVLTLLVTSAAYWIGVRRFMFIPLFISTVSLFVTQWVFGLMSSMVPFYIFLPVITIYYLKYIYIRMYEKQPGKRVSPTIFVLYVLPLCVIAAGSAAVIPASEYPIQWEWLQQRINDIATEFEGRGGPQVYEYYSIKRSGFGKGGRLGGRVTPDDTEVFQVVTDDRPYLKGASYDVYDGGQWLNSSTQRYGLSSSYELNEFTEDTCEYMTGLLIARSNEKNNIEWISARLTPSLVTLTHLDLKTKSLFLPIKIDKITSFETATNDRVGLFYDDEGILSADKMLGRNTRYSVMTYEDSIREELVSNLIKSGGLNPHLILDLLTTDEDAIKSLAEYLKNNTDTIRQKYVQLPDSIPQRVRKLSEFIVSRADTYYEKIKSIEQYLAANYTYSLDVPNTPRDRDFVDYFLFDLKQGYCTYYATAMTVLLRCAGIPARYVEGFMLPEQHEEGSATTYIVTNRQAHAWVEVYFEGLGWIPFEPTKPFRTAFYTDPDYEGTASAQLDYFNYMRELTEEGNDGSGMDPGLLPDGGDTSEKVGSELIAIFFIVSVLVLLSLAALVNSIRRGLLYGRYAGMAPRQSIIKIYAYFLNMLRYKGFVMNKGETAMEFAERANNSCIRSMPSFEALTSAFEIARYGTEEPTEKQKNQFLFNIRLFSQETKEDLGLIRYVIYRHILGII